MKTNSKLLSAGLVLVLSLLLSVGVAAADFELVGGGMYSTLSLTKLNEEIDNFNTSLEGDTTYYPEDATIEKMDKLNSAIGFYGGMRLAISDQFGIGARYESFFTGTSGSVSLEDENGTIEQNISFDLMVNGLTSTVSTNLMNYVTVKAGAGYYFGTLTGETSTDATGDYADVLPQEDTSESIDLSGFGFKVGADYSLPITDSISANVGGSYRLLNLGPSEETYLWGSSDSEDSNTLNASGIEFRVGISFEI